MRAFLRDILTTLIMAVVIFFGLQATVSSIIVDGPSMQPDFQDEQRLLVNKAVYKFLHEPERGDVVIFHPPDNPQRGDYIKRIIGLPGESVEIIDGIVYIHKKDGSVLALDEPYISEPVQHSFKGEIIPENQYFVLGDNRKNSDDSRNHWQLPRQNIVGKAWLSIWPLDKWGLVASYRYEGE